MKEYSKETIKNMISFLISEGYIEQKGDEFPILALGVLANNVLYKEEKLYIKRKIEKEQKSIKKQDIIEETLPVDLLLFDKLRQWRKEKAIQENVPPFIITSDATLNDIASRYPQKEEDMMNIIGIGEFKFAKYGIELINVVNQYLEENKIQKEFTQKTNVRKSKKKEVEIKLKKEDTNIITYELYKQGKTIVEIANQRNLTINTIQNHLLNCYEKGLQIDLEKEIQTQYKEQIQKVIKMLRNRENKTNKRPIAKRSDIYGYKILYNKTSIKQTTYFIIK